MAAISLRSVSKTYPGGRRKAPVTAVDDVSLEIASGEVFGIIGYSGAGKSTLVRLINQLERATSGSVRVGDAELTALRGARLRREQTKIGMIFQRFNLLRSRTVAGNVAYPLEVAGVPRAKRNARVAELLEFVGLAARSGAYPEQLSGGQQQRVGIARALAADPHVLLADEATSALDPETTSEVLELLQRVNRELGVTVVVITHEMDVIASIADRVAVMEAGRVIETGSTYDIFTNPAELTTQRFVQTVVRSLPTGDDLARLRALHPGDFYTVSFTDEGVSEARVFRAFAREGVEFSLVHGGVDDIRGRVYGRLTLAVRGEQPAIDRALASIGQGVRVEVVR